MAGLGAQGGGLRAHSPHSRSAAANPVAAGEFFRWRPLPTRGLGAGTPNQPKQRRRQHLGCERPRAAGTAWKPPGSPWELGVPGSSRPSTFPPPSAAAARSSQRPRPQGGASCTQRASLSGLGCAGPRGAWPAPGARWAVCSEQTSRALGSRHRGAPILSEEAYKRGPRMHPGASGAVGPPPPARPHPYRVVELQRDPVSARGTGSRGRAAWPQAPAERPSPVADHPPARGRCPRAPAPAAVRLGLGLGFSSRPSSCWLAALRRRRPQSARSIPTARLRAAPRRAPGRWSFGV